MRHKNNMHNSNHFRNIFGDFDHNKIAPKKEAFKITFIFILISVFWIYISDIISTNYILDIKMIKWTQIIKGFLYISFVGTILFKLIKKQIELLKNALDKLYISLDEVRISNEQIRAIEEELRQKNKILEGQRDALKKSEQRYELAIGGVNDGSQIQEVVSIGTNITERKNMEKKLHRLAFYDPLTELPNRRKLEEEVNKRIEKRNKGKNIAIVYVDIDNFKHINDSLGHTSGDELLVYVSRNLHKHVHAPNLVARIGGDEFIIMLDNINNKGQITTIINKLLKHLRRPWVIQNQEFFISYSMGIAISPDDGSDFETLMKKADTAMYQAKEIGKDRFVFYSDDMQEKTIKYIQTTNRLRKAIDNNEFILYYHPFIKMDSNKVIGVEALIRWNGQEKGFIPPMEFIPIAEENGMIEEISKWVFKTAIEQKIKWEGKGLDLLMSINLSGKNLLQNDIIHYIRNLIQEKKVNASNLQIEITETATMVNLHKAMKTISAIREMGIKIALDDFGTGYSSLNYLKNLPIDVLKMDRDFIKSIMNENEEEIIVPYVIQMGHILNLQIIAEGIETKEQESFLKKHKCDIGQGYLFSKPIPAEDLETFFESY